jgi:RHS repeat-associated protein
MEAISSVPPQAKQKLEFAYDFFARRILKKVYTWNVLSSSYELQSTTRFVYDGWNLTAELNASNSLIRSYVWGQDFSGSLHGAAGIEFIQQQDNLIAGYDGNGNVTSLVNASSNQLAAQYEYDPSGSLLKAVGSSASSNRFRFSTKYEDEETGLLLYGYRYFTPSLGRWLSRDPSEEAGGVNLYAFSGNDLINGVDYLGLWKIKTPWQGGWTDYTGTVEAECDESLKRLAYLITGHESDWVVLGIPDDVKPGQIVNIDPLLDKFEQRLRDSIIKAIDKFNPQAFGVETQDQQTITSRGPTYDINRYFNPRKKYGRPDCEAATLLVMWKGLVDVLKPGELDALELRSMSPDVTFSPKQASPGQMFRADMGYLLNHSDYPQLFPSGAWRGENVIKVGTDKYWGFPLGTLSEVNWKNQLGLAYNREARARRLPTRPIDEVPGFDNKSQFFNVPSIATKVFEYRNK